jgi:hypothetical protein
MKTKVITFALIIMLAYALSLFGNLSLLYPVQIGLLVLLGRVLLSTQPDLSLAEANKTKSNEKYSIILILAACMFLQVFTIVEWTYIRKQHMILFGVLVRLLMRV